MLIPWYDETEVREAVVLGEGERLARSSATYALDAAYWGAVAEFYALHTAETAMRAREREVIEDAKKWAPENWWEVSEKWYKVRKINFRTLIEKARAVDSLKEI